MTFPSSNPLPRLFLIRHGDTDWTDSHKHTGLTDIQLNSHGEDRARQLGARLQHENFSRVITSPLVRAERTCELSGFATRAERNADLVEWDYGDYEGLTTDQIKRERPDWELFRDGAPGGESPQQVAARADRFLKSIHPITGDIAVFSSGHFSRMFVARWLGLAPIIARCFYNEPASIGILGFEHNLSEPVILLWNETQ